MIQCKELRFNTNELTYYEPRNTDTRFCIDFLFKNHTKTIVFESEMERDEQLRRMDGYLDVYAEDMD